MDFYFVGYPSITFRLKYIPKISRISRDIPGYPKVLGYPGISRLIPTYTMGSGFQMIAYGLRIAGYRNCVTTAY